MDRRSMLRLCAGVGTLGALGPALAACGDDSGTGGDNGGSAPVAFALFPGYLALMKTNVFDVYASGHSGATVAPLEGPASQTYAQLLASSSGNRPVQGGMMNDALSWSGVKDKLWQQPTVHDIPNLGKVPEQLRNDAGVPWVFNGFGISYNPEKLPSGIKSWKDLYSPALKGRVAMWPAYFDAYLMAAVAEGADSTEVEKGIEAWRKAKDNIGMWITSVAALHQAMDRGEIWAAPDYLSTVIRDAKKGMKLAAAIPTEGAVLNTYQLEVVAGISDGQRRTMHGLIDLSLGDATQKLAFQKNFLIPSNADVQVDASAAQVKGLEDFGFTAREAQQRFYKVDYRWVGDNTAKIKKLIEDNLH